MRKWTGRPWRERPVLPLVVSQSRPGVNGSDLKNGRGSKPRLLVGLHQRDHVLKGGPTRVIIAQSLVVPNPSSQ